jgi:AbrB family looped-hinge helix DNA binding protein
MLRATLTSKGQLTIPQKVREALGLRPGDQVECEVMEGEARLRPLRRYTARELRCLITPIGIPYLGPEGEKAALRQALTEKYATAS